MVQVIDDRYQVEENEYIVFRVYQDRGDDTVYGYLIPLTEYDSDGKLTVAKTEHGVTADKALPQAVEVARKFGYDYILIHDLDGLFPPDKRPEIT